MSWAPVPLRRLALALLALLALISPSLITVWVGAPSGQDIQQRVKELTDQHGVVLLSEGDKNGRAGHRIHDGEVASQRRPSYTKHSRRIHG